MTGRRRVGANGRILEKAVKDDVKSFLDQLDCCFYFMPSAGVFGIVGISDIIGLCNGRFFALEVKRDGKAEATIPQKIFLAAVRRARGFAAIVDSENFEHVKVAFVRHCAALYK